VKLREMLAVATHVHIMDDEQIDRADQLLSETAWLEEKVTARRPVWVGREWE